MVAVVAVVDIAAVVGSERTVKLDISSAAVDGRDNIRVNDAVVVRRVVFVSMMVLELCLCRSHRQRSQTATTSVMQQHGHRGEEGCKVPLCVRRKPIEAKRV